MPPLPSPSSHFRFACFACSFEEDANLLANDIAKYFAILPALFAGAGLQALNVMKLASPKSAILSAMVFNALIIPALVPLALKGVQFRPLNADQLLRRNLLVFGAGGVVAPFVGIKLIDLALGALRLV